ncbi:hypothetical protein BV22DRAFT_1035176 [Leucogyrophana mollusca]|uniref:Uncharacterized protein n=1 Tax=Leucogyrophana mollusca TaxID=85980 RepID=A0ACB8BEV9_9AGAM|nr:hypothetical protein BV22DRAFT_1035176 [Leucogyrophana mollusca]
MDDTEALDWGNEEEERGMDYDERRESAAEDAEDAVSLGGDEEDEFLTYQSRLQQGANQGGQTPPRPAHHAEKLDTAEQEPVARGRRSERQRSSTPHKSRWDSQSASEQSPMLKRAQSFGKLTHALPPKPVVSSVPFVHPSHPSIIEATAMATRLDHEKRGNGVITKSHSHEGADALPPDWEMKHPKSGRGVYYYNSRTQVSTWTRPANTTPSLSVREKDKDRPQPIELHAPEERRDKVLSTKSAEPVISSRSGRTDTDKDLSYDDRHYRPGESGSRDERPTPQVHVRQVDSYQPPRSPSPPPRHREDDRSQLNRRPPSPVGSFGDRDRARSSRRDNPRASSPISLADRYWVPSQEPAPADRPIVPRERERKRDTEEPLPSAERERRNLPRDADRSSTLSTLSASSHPPTYRPWRFCSSQGGGRSVSQASREALGVELRCTISCSSLFDFFLESTHGRSSWLHIFFPPFLNFIFVPIQIFVPHPLHFFFRTQISEHSYAR